MKIFDVEQEDYIRFCRTPFLIYLGWVVLMGIASFVLFPLYVILGGLSLLLYLGLGLYVGWSSARGGLGGFKPMIVGAVFGIAAGLLDAALWTIFITMNQAVVNFAVENTGGAVTAEYMSQGMGMLFVSSPIVWGIFMGVLAGIGSFASKHLGAKPADGAQKEPEKEEAPDRGKRPNRKFRRRK